MLLELRVENYAVIDNVVVEFAPGLNLLTGETGAGKSILIDALALLLGEKASSDVVRQGADKAVVAGVFEAGNNGEDEDNGNANGIAAILEANGIDLDDNGLIIRREISVGGKGRVWVNNQPATVAVLKQLAPQLGMIHSQAQSMFAFAFDARERLALLDDFAQLSPEAVSEAFHCWQQVRARIAGLERDEQDRLRLVDLWSFQRKEILEATLEAGEDQRLAAEKRVLANAERVYSSALAAYDHLYENDHSAAASIGAAARQLEELARIDEKFRETAAALDLARITIEDIGATLRDYAQNIQASPERLAEVEERLAVLDRLKRKYGQTLAAVIAYGDEVSRKLNELENKDEVLKQLRREAAAAAEVYLKLAREWSRRRREAAARLERLVEAELNELAMKARFKIEVSGSDEEGNWSAIGFDRVAYLIATNAGQPPGPVEHIASGGELSRIMLALKLVVAGGGNPVKGPADPEHSEGEAAAVERKSRSFARLITPTSQRQARRGPRLARAQDDPVRTSSSARSAPARTLVFDEIDTGIGGRAAEAVGRKLKTLAQSGQVLCITHLPQVASFADHHYVIEKKEAAGQTRTEIRRLDAKQRTEEIARMLSGAKITEIALKNAAQMLKAGG